MCSGARSGLFRSLDSGLTANEPMVSGFLFLGLRDSFLPASISLAWGEFSMVFK
jgi:hypothetical protein